MLAESSINPDVTYQPDVTSRGRRIKDVKKGAEYYRKLDNLAESQWKSNFPSLPAVTRKLSSLPSITTSVLSDADANLSRSTLKNMTSTPRQSLSVMSSESSPFHPYMLTPNSQISLPNLSRIQQRSGDAVSSGDFLTESRNFNPWGTSHSPLDDQTKLTKEDMEPRELPFRFRDSRKLVVKPTPRRSMPMSRVAAQERDRHQRTVTNFRSRNGTIRVIKPLDPLPEIERFQSTPKTDAFDIENIEREKTFMMLERIDRILHPNKKPAKKKPGSSEMEVLCSDGTTCSPKNATDQAPEMDTSSLLSPRAQNQSQSPTRHRGDVTYRRRDGSRHGMVNQQRRIVKFHEDPFKRSPKTFPEVLHSLEVTEEDIDYKCQSWVDRYANDNLDVSE